jgi:hypothetical protein
MPNDNALLPATIHLGYLPDELVIGHLARARESIRFVGPGLSAAARVVDIQAEFGVRTQSVPGISLSRDTLRALANERLSLDVDIVLYASEEN